MDKGLKNIDSLIVRYLENEATSEEKYVIEKWVNISLDNKRYFVRMAKTWEHSHIYLQDEAFAEERYNRFNKLRYRRRMSRIVYGISAVASVALLLLVIRFIVPSSEILLSANAENHKKEIVLPDGSVVWLNKNSTIQYPEKFISNRKVYLSGEAYFDVTSNEGRPFVVETSDFVIRVLGTRFVVTENNEEMLTEAILESGLIKLKAQITGEEHFLLPGQMATYNRNLHEIQLESVNVHNYTEWVNDQLVFENTRLKDVFIQLEKWYGIKIKCKDAVILQTPVSFTVDTETYEEILNTLQIIAPFTWKLGLDNDERALVIRIFQN